MWIIHATVTTAPPCGPGKTLKDFKSSSWSVSGNKTHYLSKNLIWHFSEVVVVGIIYLWWISHGEKPVSAADDWTFPRLKSMYFHDSSLLLPSGFHGDLLPPRGWEVGATAKCMSAHYNMTNSAIIWFIMTFITVHHHHHHPSSSSSSSCCWDLSSNLT